MTLYYDVNFDSLVGPTHHFGGLGVGNLASQSHRGDVARPRAAALQGIAKMRCCVALGARQAILPPQRRPVLRILERLGFQGAAADLLQQARSQSPALLSAVWSASSMWTANAATVSPGSVTADGKTHLTIANLSSSLHRSLEPAQTMRLFRRVFRDPSFVIHAPLPGTFALRDEGAANHLWLHDKTGTRGLDVFVYGSDGTDGTLGKQFMARHSLAASQAIARIHRLDPRNVFFLRQHPAAIDAGAFHNDVVATSRGSMWLHHQYAYIDAESTIDAIEARFKKVTGEALIRIEVAQTNLSLDEAVQSYLFNSQLLSRDNDSQALIMLCPSQVHEISSTRTELERLISKTDQIVSCEFVELRESMSNGGGPACLRLRVPMTQSQWDRLPVNLCWSESLANELCAVIQTHYPETLVIDDLVNVELIEQASLAVDAIERVFTRQW